MLQSTVAWRRSWAAVTRGAASSRVVRALTSAAPGLEEQSDRWDYDHDVLVVGGGIVGCTLACRLAQDLAAMSSASPAGGGTYPSGDQGNSAAAPGGAASEGVSDGQEDMSHDARHQKRPLHGRRQRRGRQPLRVGLIELRPPASLEAALARDGPDPRVYSLAPSSVNVLRDVGVWDEVRHRVEGGGPGSEEQDGVAAVLKDRSQAFGSMQVWDDRGAGHLRFDGEGEAGGALGFISEHGVIHSALFDRVRELEAEGFAKLMCPSEVKRVTFPPVGPGGAVGPLKVTVATGDGGETIELSCRLLVAADGGDSKVAKMLGFSSFGWGYGQRAVVATVKLSESHGDTAFQRYLSRGPLAMLPLEGGKQASLVWSTTPEHAESLKSMTEAEFLKEVNDALRNPPTIGLPVASASSSSSSSSSKPSSEHSSEVSSACPSSSPTSSFPGAAFPSPPAGGGVAGLVFGGVSSLAALPFAAASALGEGVAKEAEGVAGALAGLSLGLQEGGTGGAESGGRGGGGGGGGGGFCTPPEAVEVMTPRLGFDLSLRQAHRYTGDRMALAGDAAHTIHPMAGQGLNLGIADADALARAVLEGRSSGMDVGSKTLLGRYEEERKTEALVMMGALDALHRLFGSNARVVAAARSAGLSALNAAGPAKRLLARRAMGGGSK